MKAGAVAFLALGLGLVLAAIPAAAQHITGTPGSPSATTALDGQAAAATAAQVRRGDQGGRHGLEAVVAPDGGAAQGRTERAADHDRRSGYGVPSTFGGVIPTPALDRIAKSGLRYTQFHSTALCSPTARGDHYRAQPPRGRFRCDHRICDRLSGLRL